MKSNITLGLIIFIVISLLAFTSCNAPIENSIDEQSSTLESLQPSLSNVQTKIEGTQSDTNNNADTNNLQEVDKMQKEATPIDLKNGWIKSTNPIANSDHSYPNPPVTKIVIEFNTDMDSTTLNNKTILVFSAKRRYQQVSGIFDYSYDTKLRTLTMTFKEAYYNFGSGNSIEILITKMVQNAKHKEMGKSVYFAFSQ